VAKYATYFRNSEPENNILLTLFASSLANGARF